MLREEQTNGKGYRALMSRTRTRLTARVRIDPKQLKKLYKMKDTKTVAGYLDKIINQYYDIRAITDSPINE